MTVHLFQLLYNSTCVSSDVRWKDLLNTAVMVITVNIRKEMYQDAHLIIGGDLNDAADDQMDRLPSREDPSSRLKAIPYLCEQFNVTGTYRYTHPYQKEYTWSNVNSSLEFISD